jgi:transposase
MAKARSLVGLDVHATKVVAAVLDGETGQLQTFAMSGENLKVAAFCAGLPRPVRAAYEAGPTGYGLARELAKRGVECVVAAPSKIPRASGDRVKTDRRDAEHLVRLLLAGKLHAVRVPGDEEEALRDLVRARDAVRMDLMRCRHRLSKLLLRHGIRFDDGHAWTQRHRDWLGTVTLEWPAAQATMLDARGAIDALAHRREQLEREITAMLPSSPWVAQAGRLRCLRGVDTLTAVGLCAEIGDFERFARAEQLMRRSVSTPRRVSSGCRLAVKRFALGPAGRRAGDGGAEHPLGGSEVGPGARRCRDRHQDMLLQAAVFGGVVGRAVLPAAPDHAAPCASKGADRAGMVVTALDRASVVVAGPGMPAARGVGEHAERVTQALVACEAERSDLAFA